MLSKQTFGQQMSVLCTLFKEEMSPVQADAYYEVLKNLSDESLIHAVREYSGSDATFFPRAGQLKQLASKIGLLDGNEAWRLVLKDLRDTWSPSTLPEGIKEIVRDMGGVRYLGQLTERELDFKRREFLSEYVHAPVPDPTKKVIQIEDKRDKR